MVELITIANLGLLLLVIGWAIQSNYSKTAKTNKKEIQKGFLAFYGLGVFVLVLDGLAAGQWVMALLNFFALVLVVEVMNRTKK